MAKRKTITTLRRTRRALKISRYVAAKATGIPYSSLVHLESGVTPRVNLKYLAALGTLYGKDFTVSELLA
jgi:hypothetical protein